MKKNIVCYATIMQAMGTVLLTFDKIYANMCLRKLKMTRQLPGEPSPRSFPCTGYVVVEIMLQQVLETMNLSVAKYAL